MSGEHDTTNANAESILTMLFFHLGRVEGGEETVESFKTWFFQNSEWVDRTDDNDLADLGNGVMAILYMYDDFFPKMTELDFVKRVRREIADAGFSGFEARLANASGFPPVTFRVTSAITFKPAPVRNMMDRFIPRQVIEAASVFAAEPLALAESVVTGSDASRDSRVIVNSDDEWIPTNLTAVMNHR